MSRENLVLGLASSAILTLSVVPAHAQDNPEASKTANKRIAMVLPKAPAATKTGIPVSVRLNGEPISKVDPEAEFASHPRLTKPSHQKAIEDNLKAAIIDGAGKAEMLSRSYNHHMANLIVWLANSLTDSTTYTPAANPRLRSVRPLEPKSSNNSNQQIFQID